MAEKITFLQLAERVIREERRPMSPGEIWKSAIAKGYDKMLSSEGKTPWASLYAAIFLDARDAADTIFYKIGARPARYFLKELAGSTTPEKLEKAAQAPDTSVDAGYKYKESDLHPFLTYFSRAYFKAYTKTINHSTSKKNEFGEWVHPDVIGVYFPVKDWSVEVLELGAAMGNAGVKMYSFELKRSLGFTNLRESFFQAVSNSSWANEGYLVAAEISQDEDFLAELRRLSTSFGIGVIKLSVDDPDSSAILYPAREREFIDWETLNKMTMNRDVCELLVRITQSLRIREVFESHYDKVPELEGLLQILTQKRFS